MTQLLVDLGRKYSSAEFEELDLPDDNRYELIGGNIVMAPSAGDEHNTIGGKLFSTMWVYSSTQKAGKVWYETDFVLDPENTRRPDIAFVVAERVPPISKGAVKVVPDLAIEIWSDSDLDTQKHRQDARAKIQLYQDKGVRLIWAINPRSQTVYIYHSDTTDNPSELQIGDELDGENLISGFMLSLKTLFEIE